MWEVLHILHVICLDLMLYMVGPSKITLHLMWFSTDSICGFSTVLQHQKGAKSDLFVHFIFTVLLCLKATSQIPGPIAHNNAKQDDRSKINLSNCYNEVIKPDLTRTFSHWVF